MEAGCHRKSSPLGVDNHTSIAQGVAPYIQAIAQRNATESPLLKIPAELRLLIFEFVTGSATVHIAYILDFEQDPRPLSHSNPWEDPSFLTGFRTKAQRGRSGRLSLPRLDLVCRQMHEETSMMLYSMPTFRFSNEFIVGYWLETLRPVQKRAVRNVVVGKKRWPKTDDLEQLLSARKVERLGRWG